MMILCIAYGKCKSRDLVLGSIIEDCCWCGARCFQDVREMIMQHHPYNKIIFKLFVSHENK